MDPVQYQVSKADYVDVYVVARLPLFAKLFGLLTLLVALVEILPLFARCGCSALTLERISAAVFNGALLSAIVCGSILLLGWLSANALARTLKKIGQGTSVAWDEDYLHLRTQFGSDSYPWTLFEKWSETRRVLLLSLTRMHVFHFPKHDFSSDELEALRAQIARANIPKA